MAKEKLHEIEEELRKVTKLKPKKKESRQDYFARVIYKVQELDDEIWEGLENETQLWVNAGAKALKKDKEIPEFDDEDEDADESEDEEDDDDEDSSDDDDDSSDDDDDEDESEEDEDSSDDDEDEDEDEDEDDKKSKSKKKDKKSKDKDEKKSKSKDDKKSKGKDKKSKDKDEKKSKSKDDKKSKKSAKSGDKPEGMKVRIKKLLVEDPTMSAEDILSKLKKAGGDTPAKPTIAGIRADFRHSLKVLKSLGHLDDIEI